MGSAIQPHPVHIPIRSAPSAAGCGACLHDHTEAGPVCRSLVGEPCAAPTLSGPADEVQRLLRALAPLLGTPGADGRRTGTGLLKALHVQPGEVELQLVTGRHCGGAALADSAFQALRSLLPDTDIYVTLPR